MSDFRFNWREFAEKFAVPGVVVNCRTPMANNEFLAMAHAYGYTWEMGRTYLEYSIWNNLYRQDTCYNIYKGLGCSYKFALEDGYDIIVYDDLMD